MTWVYFQRTGDIVHNGKYAGKGYSGHSGYCNQCWAEDRKNEGPIPRGRYTIGAANGNKGPYTMRLTPVGHQAHGRTGFLIHGDSRQFPGAASTGCIVLPYHARKLIFESSDIDLEVI
ncbi:MAG: DUF2778 domain-containing protein [Geobacteraceae bacterium]|nr:DUF2778 domain-containing protein [Geobacteraceae bacterium]